MTGLSETAAKSPDGRVGLRGGVPWTWVGPGNGAELRESPCNEQPRLGGGVEWEAWDVAGLQ